MAGETIVPNISDNLKAVFRQETKTLQEEIVKIRRKHDNPKIIGDEAERVFKEFISGYLPETYQIANGQINDRDGLRSREIDVAVCNPYHPFTYSKEGRGMLFIEATEAAIEVKSSIKSEAHIRTTIKKCQSVRNLREEPVNGMIRAGKSLFLETPYILFAFGSDFTLSTLLGKITSISSELKIPESERMDLVYVLDRGLLVNYKDRDELVPPSGVSGLERLDVDPSILSFLVMMNTKMPQYAYIPNLLMYYMYPDL